MKFRTDLILGEFWYNYLFSFPRFQAFCIEWFSFLFLMARQRKTENSNDDLHFTKTSFFRFRGKFRVINQGFEGTRVKWRCRKIHESEIAVSLMSPSGSLIKFVPQYR